MHTLNVESTRFGYQFSRSRGSGASLLEKRPSALSMVCGRGETHEKRTITKVSAKYWDGWGPAVASLRSKYLIDISNVLVLAGFEREINEECFVYKVLISRIQ